MKKDSFYFPHDYNSRNDVKCLFLRQQLGMEGYGIFWFLVESLSESGGVLPLKIIPVLAMQMQVPDVKVNAVINNFELFVIHEESFFSVRLNEHLELRKTLSEMGKLGVKIREAKREALRGALSDPLSNKRKGKEIKESKLKESNSDKSPLKIISFKYWTEKEFVDDIEKNKSDANKDLLNTFFKYWKELSPAGKMKFQLEKTWETKLRIEKWAQNQNKWSKKDKNSYVLDYGPEGKFTFDKA